MSTREVLFVDYSALVALNDSTDASHAAAVKYVRSLMGQTVRLTTSFWTVAAAATELRQRKGAKKASEFLAYFEKEGVDVLVNNETIRRRAQVLFEEQKKVPDLDFFDCLKAATMHYYGINKIFTFAKGMDKFKVIRVPKD